VKLRSRRASTRSAYALALILAALLTWPYTPPSASAGGPLFIGSPTMGTDGQAFVWDLSSPVTYRVDGGGLGNMTNAAAVARVQAMFDAWQNVPTAAISYTNAGAIQPVGAFTDGDVNTPAEFDEMDAECFAGNQTPVVFDADGSLFSALGFSSGVIGFAGACNFSGNHIIGALAALNGRWINGNQGDGELTSFEFDQAFTHEFGHLSGLDHSQINVDVLNGSPDQCSQDSLAGLPLMFPFLFCQARQPGFPILSPDDEAWISELYPETGSGPGQTPYVSAYGFIEGTIFFSDGITHTQGVNVIARRTDDPATTTQNEARRIAFSVVSGYRFTGLPGQTVTTNNPGSSFGSRNTLLIGAYRIPVTPGTYTVEVESVNPAFAGGSGVGPLSPPVPSPGPREFWDNNESSTDSPSSTSTIIVAAGQTVTGIDIILNNTPPRFDAFESAHLLPATPAGFPSPRVAWLRRYSLPEAPAS